MNLTPKKGSKKMISSHINLSLTQKPQQNLYMQRGPLELTNFIFIMCISNTKAENMENFFKDIIHMKHSKTFQEGESKAKKMASLN